MKLINSTHGTAAVQVSADDVVPRSGVAIQQLVEFVAKTYQFSVKPNFPEGIPPLLSVTNLTFQSGTFTAGENRWPLFQLAIVANGDVMTASDTVIAERALNDFMSLLDAELGYSFASADKAFIFQSNLVVEFDRHLEEAIEAFSRIETILNGANLRPQPFKVKRLGFGIGDPVQLPVLNSVDDLLKSDFVIERRAGEAYEKNRYFSSAPCKTPDHIQILQDIERAIGAAKTPIH
jgi:hypothetical protein